MYPEPLAPICPPSSGKRNDFLDTFRAFEADSLLHLEDRWHRLLVVRASGHGKQPWKPPEVQDVALDTYELPIDGWQPDPTDPTKVCPRAANQEPDPRGPCEVVSRDPQATPVLHHWTYWLCLDEAGVTDSGLTLDHALEIIRRQFQHDAAVWLRRRDTIPNREGLMLTRADRIRRDCKP